MDSLQCDHLLPDHSTFFRESYFNNICDPVEEDLYSYPHEDHGNNHNPHQEEYHFHQQQDDYPKDNNNNSGHLTLMDYATSIGEGVVEGPEDVPMDLNVPVKQRFQANARERCRTQRCGSQRFIFFFVLFFFWSVP